MADNSGLRVRCDATTLLAPPTDCVDGLVIEGVGQRLRLEPLRGATLAPARDSHEPHVVVRVLCEVVETEGVPSSVDVPRLPSSVHSNIHVNVRQVVFFLSVLDEIVKLCYFIFKTIKIRDASDNLVHETTTGHRF